MLNLHKYTFRLASQPKYTKVLSRLLSSSPEKAEEKLKTILNKNFPQAKSIEVVDVSGGCGAMYEIAIVAPEFKGLSIVKQHKLVTAALKEEIRGMHGLRIHTSHS